MRAQQYYYLLSMNFNLKKQISMKKRKEIKASETFSVS